ncbi:MAG: hypothetical protein EZS28_035710, partial [Streblomastix strix]
ADIEPNIPNIAQELWGISHTEKYVQAGDLRKAIRAVMQSADTIGCKLIGSPNTLTQPPRSDSTMKRIITLKPEKYMARSKKSSKMRKTKNKRERYQRRQNMRDPKSNSEYQIMTPTKVVEDKKAQQDAAKAENITLLLDPFNFGRINKQSKSSLSLQEVVYNQRNIDNPPEEI